MRSKDVAIKLAHAQSEKEVSDILNSPFFKEGEWRPVGYHLGISSNYNTVENLSSQPMAALAEIITNSLDAILLKRYKLDTQKRQFMTMREAIDFLIGEDSQEKVYVTADGGEKSPNLIVEDLYLIYI